MSTLVTADPHFGHKNIIKFCKRPFRNVNEMDEAMIYNWNSVVNHNDEVHVVGDVAFCCTMDYALSIMKRLNGTKHLVVGNHDELALEMNDVRPGTWKTIKDLSEVYIHNQKMVLCHYALRTWHHSYKGVIHLFGHTHGTLPPYGKSFDVGMDVWNFTPVTGKQLIDKANSLPNAHEIPKDKQWDKTNNSITS
jgi:calcineurin-like phosphoesterase family protein